MAGGVWTSQNKIRPGAYINFESARPVSIEVGDRGIATLAMELDWGADDKLIEVTLGDLIGGNALALIGLMASDEKALLANLALQNAAVLKIYKLNKGGEKATLKNGDNMDITAKYAGAFGNKIAIIVTPHGETDGEIKQMDVQTYANGYLADVQRVSKVEDLVANAFVTFSGEGEITEMSSTLLSGGTSGTITDEGEEYEKYFELLRVSKWNTLAITVDDGTIKDSAISFIEIMREDEGKYVQAVVANHGGADYEGVINNVNGVVMNDKEITAAQFCAWVAGANAGAEIVESITGKVVTGATSITGLKTNSEIIEGLKNGQFLLSLNQDGAVKVEKDINSLHTFTDKSYIFSKNRVIRELDEIGSGIERIWETTYLGKVTNNENGRTLFKSSIIDYLTELQNRGAIDEFDSNSIIVEAGDDIDAVIASIAIKPLDSMEFLYMTVNIDQ